MAVIWQYGQDLQAVISRRSLIFHLPRELVLASLQRSGSSRIPTTSADGYFRYIAESVVNANLQKQNETDRMRKISVALCF